jgi:succinate-semialdehyde dehydrogenase/glutarate-semialdehyde dehydrogenase
MLLDWIPLSSIVNGKALESDSKFEVLDPATGNTICSVSSAGETETIQAIESANLAFSDWSRMTGKERSKILMRWFQLIRKNAKDLAALLSMEQGKPLSEATGEIFYGASFIEWFAEEAKRVYGDTIPAFQADHRIVTMKQPIGVVGAITPWNFPNAMITRKVAPALAAGCTVVLKPSEETPLSALALVQLAKDAGVPDGVFNLVVGEDPAPIGDTLCGHQAVRKLSFTGSTEVGKMLMAKCAPTVKKVSLELGGNAPFIVFDDADLDKAVAGVVAAKYRNTGQTCICANRIFVHEQVYDEFVEKFSSEVGNMRVGLATDDGVRIGPLINEKGMEKVERLVEDAVNKGAVATTGGHRLESGKLFFEPTVLRDADPSMQCFNEEIFGPVAPVYAFKTEEQVVEMANATNYGLAAYFFARDMGRVWRVAEKLEYGMIGVNESAISSSVSPFGGVKESGIGKEGSKYGIEEFLETKSVIMNIA